MYQSKKGINHYYLKKVKTCRSNGKNRISFKNRTGIQKTKVTKLLQYYVITQQQINVMH